MLTVLQVNWRTIWTTINVHTGLYRVRFGMFCPRRVSPQKIRPITHDKTWIILSDGSESHQTKRHTRDVGIWRANLGCFFIPHQMKQTTGWESMSRYLKVLWLEDSGSSSCAVLFYSDKTCRTGIV